MKIFAPYDIALKELRDQGFREITLEENALIRMQEGKDSDISKYGNRVREDIIYVPNKGAFLTKDPAISELPVTATIAHRYGNEFYPTKYQVERALEDSVQLPYDIKPIPTNRFNDEEITAYAFGEQAEDYGEFLRDAGISEMPIWLVISKRGKPFARKLWFNSLSLRSELDGLRDLLYFEYMLVGVREDVTKIFVPKKKPKKKLIYINPFEVEWED